MYQNTMRKLNSMRDRRFIALARDETTCRGYQKYAPITKGPWINGLFILIIIPVVPFYLAWRLLLKFFGKIRIST